MLLSLVVGGLRSSNAASFCVGAPLFSCPSYVTSSDCINADCYWNSLQDKCETGVQAPSCTPRISAAWCTDLQGCQWLDTDAVTPAQAALICLTSIILVLLLIMMYLSIRTHRAKTANNSNLNPVDKATLDAEVGAH